jgi:hypothetical protein
MPKLTCALASEAGASSKAEMAKIFRYLVMPVVIAIGAPSL